MNDIAHDVFAHHRGPYTLQGQKATKKPGIFSTSVVMRNVEPEDVEDMVQALLTDPRDTFIGKMAIWSERENQFVTSIGLKEVA